MVILRPEGILRRGNERVMQAIRASWRARLSGKCSAGLRGLRVATLVTGLAAAVMVAAAPAGASSAPPYGTRSDDSLAPCPAGTVGCPASDPFYKAPSNLATRANGTLVGMRPATIAQGGPSGRAAYTISYRSEDSFGAPVLDTATVILPSAGYSGSGGTPLVSFQYPIDSLGGQCAPSYALAHGTNANVSGESGDVQTLLDQGYAVVASDFDGPAEQFIASQQEGHAVLDGIRAAESLPGSGLSRATRVALDGYSGGAHATGWAQELAASYAPDLRIIGAAEGGTPADLTATGKYLDGTAFFGLDFLSTGGLARAFPGDGITSHLNAAGRTAFASASTECVNQGVAAYPYGHFDSYTTQPDLIDSPPLQALLTHEKLGQSAPHFPLLSYHAYNDEIVPFTQDVKLVEYYCAHNVPVDFVELAGDHVSGESEGSPLVSAFLRNTFGGQKPTDNCATIGAVAGLPQVPPVTAPGGGGSSGSNPGQRPGKSGAKRRSPKVKLRYLGPRRRLHGLLFRLSTSTGVVRHVTVELERGHKVKARVRLVRLSTRARRVVLRVRGRVPQRGRYTVLVLVGRTRAVRRSLRVRSDQASRSGG